MALAVAMHLLVGVKTSPTKRSLFTFVWTGALGKAGRCHATGSLTGNFVGALNDPLANASRTETARSQPGTAPDVRAGSVA